MGFGSFVLLPQMENHYLVIGLSKLQAFREVMEGGKRDSKSWPTYLELDLEV